MYDSSLFIAGISIISWYFTNISTLILNKYLYQMVGFVYPFSLTIVHMVVGYVGSSLVLYFFPSTFPPQKMSSYDYWRKIVPLSIIFCVNIILGNISLRYIPVSFMQTIKSSVPAFTVIIQFIRGTRHTLETYLSIIVIVGGVSIASYSEVNFDMIGFVCAVLASIVTATLAIATGVLLTEKLNPMSLLNYMSLPSAIFLFPFSFVYELQQIQSNEQLDDKVQLFWILSVSGFIAFLLNLTSFWVIKSTSPLTYTVAGNFKVILSITISVLVFKNQITYLNGIGCSWAVIGVMWYNRIRYIASTATATTTTTSSSIPPSALQEKST